MRAIVAEQGLPHHKARLVITYCRPSGYISQVFPPTWFQNIYFKQTYLYLATHIAIVIVSTLQVASSDQKVKIKGSWQNSVWLSSGGLTRTVQTAGDFVTMHFLTIHLEQSVQLQSYTDRNNPIYQYIICYTARRYAATCFLCSHTPRGLIIATKN